MEMITPEVLKELTEVEKLHEMVMSLQDRLLAREQTLDDLARAVEIAEITKQFHLVTSFRTAAEEALQDRVVVPTQGEDQDLKVRIYE